MSTQFFERQEGERRHTRWLVLGFVLAMLAVVAVINLVVLVGVYGDRMLYAARHDWWLMTWVTAVVLVTVLIASWHRSSQLRLGGAVVARSLGGIQINGNDPDLARKRLLNIVEEMAIAARIRKPMVFVLPNEPGINAFAAGHSPDEAAVAVTQGALERLDRDQLQAVIGHEFSHVLNGDMQINMRLTAWIFGLFVITDLARRLMEGRSRGKDAARVKLIAFGVFVAGSVGMIAGRLLQAAVSRRREHLADASAVQFTRNPQALQSAFITMAASPDGSRLRHASAPNVAHMFFARSDPTWANKYGGSLFATHPTLEQRVRALDARITDVKFRALVSDERRKVASRRAAAEAAQSADAAVADTGGVAAAHEGVAPLAPLAPAMPVGKAHAAHAPADIPATAAMAAVAPAKAAAGVAATAPVETGATGSRRAPELALAETLPSGVRMIAGRALPPDVLRNRLSQEAQTAIAQFVAQVEHSTIAVQAVFIATMLAAEPAKSRTQLTRLASSLGIELFKETSAQIPRIAQLAAAARLPMLMDLFALLESMDPAHRKRLRAVARAFAPTVATGDMLRYSVTRMLEKRLGKPSEDPTPVPLHDQAPAVCELYAALAQCRFGPGKQGQNAYRAGVMGMLPPQKWAPYPDTLITPAALDAAMMAVARVHPTGKRSFSEGMARVIAVGGRLTVPQVDLLRGTCVVVDCPVPLIPIDVTFDEADVTAPASQAAAH